MTRVTILGSGTNAVVPARGSPGYLLEFGKTVVLMESGQGTLYRLALMGRTVFDIHMACYSHLHPDHVSDLLPLLHSIKRDPTRPLEPSRLRLVGPPSVLRYYERLVKDWGPSVSSDKYSLVVEPEAMSDSHLEFNSIQIDTRHVEHTQDSLAYRFEYDGLSVVYSGDTDMCEAIETLASNCDLLIMDCAFPSTRKRKGHPTPKEIMELAEKIHPGRVVLTHIHPGWSSEEWSEVKDLLGSPRFLVGQDFMQIELIAKSDYRVYGQAPKF